MHKEFTETHDLKNSVSASNLIYETEKLIRISESSDVMLERVLPRDYSLSYACLIIPRFSKHKLIGDLTESLHHLIKNICISFSWKLEFIDIRPEYLQWVMVVGVTTSPSFFMRIIMEQTSKQIFKEFRRFKRENTSGDFWAPGYMVLAGTQPYPPEMIEEFIKVTRQHQGLPAD